VVGVIGSRWVVLAIICLALVGALGCQSADGESAPAKARADAGVDSTGDNSMDKATFAAGCFWGVEAAFRNVKGVSSTQVGYTGGKTEDPTYREVCSDRTGHAEAVEVTYDPDSVSYSDLLDVFWSIHDPTQVDRQGPDVGSQYRSAVFFHTPEQEAEARASKAELEKKNRFKRPVATEIVPASEFYRAEEYHQRYFEKRGIGSCPSKD
jgi:peptide-methionine (S)-S-oxide reductase